MTNPAEELCLEPKDWERICAALRYLARDLHHRSYEVDSSRRQLLWREMDETLALADRLKLHLQQQG